MIRGVGRDAVKYNDQSRRGGLCGAPVALTGPHQRHFLHFHRSNHYQRRRWTAHGCDELESQCGNAPFIRVHNGGSGPLIADAVYVVSAALYNDGSPAPQVTLKPFDGILLQRQTPVAAPTSRVNSVVNAASYRPAIASGEFVSVVRTGIGNSSRSWTSTSLRSSNPLEES
jgi:hypothetical protein